MDNYIQQALELACWKAHMAELNARKAFAHNTGLSIQSMWSELSAFVSVLPRRAGKTTMISRMVKELRDEESCVLLSNDRLTELYKPLAEKGIVMSINSQPSYYPGDFKYRDIHLFIDEFLIIPRNELRRRLEFPRKSVTLVGSLVL